MLSRSFAPLNAELGVNITREFRDVMRILRVRIFFVFDDIYGNIRIDISMKME